MYQRIKAHWRYATVAILMLATLSACGGGQAEPAAVQLSDPAIYKTTSAVPRTDFVTYSDAEYPFMVNLPREWFMGQLDYDTYGLVVASTNEPGQERSAITVIVEPVSIADGIQPTIDGAEAGLRGQSGVRGFNVDLARPVTVNDMEGQERLYSYQLDDQKLRQRSFYVSDGEQVYAISLTAPQSLYPQHDTLFTEVIASFQGDAMTASQQ